MPTPLLLFVLFGALFGLATYGSRHLFNEGATRPAAPRPGLDLPGRLWWMALCSCLWPLMALSGAYGAWRRQAAQHTPKRTPEARSQRR